MALHCPYCQSGLEKETARCAVCGLCMDSADDAFGVAPAVTAGLCDPESLLDAGETRRLRRALGAFRESFPQVEPTVMICPVEARHPLGPWVFWFFNRSDLGAALSTGAENRHVLLVIDSENLRAAATVGYGLEPFLTQGALARILENLVQPLEKEEFGEAAVRFVEELGVRLGIILAGMPQPASAAKEGTAGKTRADW